MASIALPLVFLISQSVVASDTNPEPATPANPLELRHSIGMDALRQEFRETGMVGLVVPLLGKIMVAGEGSDLTSHGNRSLNLSTIALLGSVQGYSNSFANLYLGEYGVYGAIEIPWHNDTRIKFEFDAVETTWGTYETWVHADETLETPAGQIAGEGRDGTPVVYAEIPLLNNVLPPITSAMTNPTSAGGENFESGASGWTFGGLWRVTTRKYATPSHSAWYGDPSSGTYASGSSANSGNLDSPSFVIPYSGARLQFQSWYQTEDTASSYDRKLVQISTNGGSSWMTIHQVTGVPTSAWTVKSVDLSAYAGQSAKLRFRFDTFDGLYNAYEGWYLDDIAVTETAGPPAPPPSDGCVSPPKSSGLKAVDTTSPYKAKSTADEASSPPDPCASQPDCSGGYGISWVTYHAELDFRNQFSNWRDRILSAVAQYAPMWQALCISLRAWPIEAGAGNVLSNNNCDPDGYSQWLANTWQYNPNFFNDDAYQLWTKRNLSGDGTGPDGAYCFGSSDADEVNVARTTPTFEAASIVEGYDASQCCDTYDPDEVAERGVVSGHEMAHVYGEENHPYKCNKDEWYTTAYDCNLMRRCKDVDRVSFYFTTASKREIMFRYHYGQEATSGNENNADCP